MAGALTLSADASDRTRYGIIASEFWSYIEKRAMEEGRTKIKGEA